MKALDQEKASKLLSGINDKAYDPKLIYLLNDNFTDYKLPAELFRYVMKYFQMLYDKHSVEAAVLLMLNKQTKEWRVLFIPQVDCSGAAVNYLIPVRTLDNLADNKKRYYEEIFKDDNLKNLMIQACDIYDQNTNDGFSIFGTIHSHCNFGAFHSGVDDSDELDFEGLHITIGNVRSGWTYSVRYNVGGAFFKKELLDVVDAPDIQSLETGIDDIQVEEFHLNLMMPNVGKTRYFGESYEIGSYGGRGLWSNNDDDDNRTWYHNRSYGNWNSSNTYNSNGDEDISKDHREVNDVNNTVILYDTKLEKVIFTSFSFHATNKERFPSNRYKMLNFSNHEIMNLFADKIKFKVSRPQNPKNYKEFNDKKKEKKSFRKDSEGKRIYLFNDPLINVDFQESTDTLVEASILEPRNVKVKAKKKGRR
jgi:hypothetical protein